MHHLLCVLFYTSWHFYAFSGTNLLTRCHSASSLFFCCFCVSKKLHRKYSRNWMKQKPKFLFFLTRDGSKAEMEGSQVLATPCHGVGAPWPRRAMMWAPGPPPDIALPPIYSPRQENPKGPNSFPENILQAIAVVDVRSGGSRSSS
jgi:hypothetical protein